jgi:hypothetical protein
MKLGNFLFTTAIMFVVGLMFIGLIAEIDRVYGVPGFYELWNKQ